MIEFSLEIDAAGLMCPLPLLRLKKALMSLESGHVVKIIATDPAAHLDFGVLLINRATTSWISLNKIIGRFFILRRSKTQAHKLYLFVATHAFALFFLLNYFTNPIH